MSTIRAYPLFGSWRLECETCGAYATEFSLQEAIEHWNLAIQAPWAKETDPLCKHIENIRFSLEPRHLSYLAHVLGLIEERRKAARMHTHEGSNPQRNIQSGQALYQAEQCIKEWGTE